MPAKKRKPTGGKPGRKTIYTQALGKRICDRLADGESVRAICRTDGMPNERTVRRWAADPEHPFAPQYARSREIGYMKMADELLEIADDGSNDWMVREGKDGAESWVLNGEHVQRSRLRVDTRKWLLSKMLPKVFGDKMTNEVVGKDGKDLMPEPSSRDLARAVVNILGAAHMEQGD